VNTTIRAQVETIQSEFLSRPEGLQRHVQRVLVEALELAAIYDLDPERVELAVWGHDLFRAHSGEDLMALAKELGVPIDPVDVAQPTLLHGPIGAVVMRERFAITDEDVLAAVRDHTLGLGQMSLIAKVILLADKFERRKRNRTPVMKEIRRLARRDLDTALLCWADWKWVEERTHGWGNHPQHWLARQTWVAGHHLDAAMPGRVTTRQFTRAARAK
jgi:predicted HD superfamily hydrolase involved in NAD metabolism